MRFDALNQFLQNLLHKETSIIPIEFNDTLFIQCVTNNTVFELAGIHLSFAGNKLITKVLQYTLETTKHLPLRNEPDHITSTTDNSGPNSQTNELLDAVFP